MCLANSSAQGEYTLYDDFTYPSSSFDRTKWWRGGLAGVDGSSAILKESDLTTSMMFLEGDFKFVMGGPSSSSQGLFGLGDIDDGDPYLILSDNGVGWRFHVRNGAEIYTGPVVASSLAKGDVVVFHWDSAGSSVSINGLVKDSQTTVHPPHMPITMLEWNNAGTKGQIIIDAVSYAVPAVSGPKALPMIPAESARVRVLSAKLVEDTYVDSSNSSSNFNGSSHQIYIRNCRYHPDLTGAGKTVDAGHLGLLQFALPQLPVGWSVTGVRLEGMVAQNHNFYGRPGWAPDRPIELEVLGLSENLDLAKVSYNTVHDAAGRSVITDYTASGSVNFTFGSQARSLEVLRFNTCTTPVGSVLRFPDQQGALRAFVQSKISRKGPKVISLALGPGRTQSVSGMDCDFKFYAKENTVGRVPMSLQLELERMP